MKRIATIFALIGLFAQPALADGTINTLSAGAALTGTEQIPMFQTANPAVTTTPNALKTFIGAGTGTVTSISAGCGSSTGGGAITTTGTIAAVNNPLHPTSGNFVAATVCGNTAYYDSASDQSPTLPTAVSAGAGGFFTTCSVNHAQTITRSGSDTIGITGAATTYSLGSGTVTAPTCVGFQSDGTSIWTPTPYGSSGASGITIGTTTITSGANTNIEYNNSGVVGEYTITGTGTVVAMQTSPNFLTSVLGNTTSILTFPAAATWQLGAADAATAVAQTLRVQSIVTGTTNVAGQNFIIKASQGTGSAAGGNIQFQTAPQGSTGSTPNALVTRLTIDQFGNLSIGSTGTPSISRADNLWAISGFYEANNVGGYCWSSTNNATAACDTSLTRSAAGVVAVGSSTVSVGLGGGTVLVSLVAPGTIYSAAGTALPSCAAGTNGYSAIVSDATTAAFRAAYVSGGAQMARVLCVSGTGWITD